MAIEARRPEGKLIHHSDRSGQYTSDDFRKVPLAINARLNPSFHNLLAELLGTSFTCSQK